MDTSFIRNQMIAKLKEFEFYNNLYQSAIHMEKDKIAAAHTQEELDEYVKATDELKAFNNTTNQVIGDIDKIVTRLCESHKKAMERFKNVALEHKKESTSESDKILT